MKYLCTQQEDYWVLWSGKSKPLTHNYKTNTKHCVQDAHLTVRFTTVSSDNNIIGMWSVISCSFHFFLHHIHALFIIVFHANPYIHIRKFFYYLFTFLVYNQKIMIIPINLSVLKAFTYKQPDKQELKTNNCRWK